eukprot:6196474-Pleurochrysis_carterae.AAC.2
MAPLSQAFAFNFTATLKPSKGAQLQEVQFFDRNGLLLPMLSASNPGGQWNSGEGPYAVIDGLTHSPGSKWLDLNMVRSLELGHRSNRCSLRCPHKIL